MSAAGRIEAVVFDFDGVLANSEPIHLTALQRMLASHGVSVSPDEYYARYVGYDDVGVFRMLAEEHGWILNEAKVAALIEEKSRIFDAIIASEDVLFPGARACVERLAAVYPLGIASGALRHEIVAILARYGLSEYFRFIVASGDTPESKPAPDPYRLAARLHGLAPSACVAIEDSRWGLESARAAGLRAVGIATTYPRAALAGADVVIDSLDEFTPALIQTLQTG